MIRETAKKALSYSRGELLGISVPAILLGGISLSAFLLVQIMLLVISRGLRTGLFGNDAHVLKYVYIGLALYLAASLFIGSFVEIGLDRILLLKLKGEPADRSMLFYYRPVMFDAIILRLFMSVRVTLLSFLLVMPGIMAVFSYSLAPYLFAQNPKMTVPKAIKVSKQLMKGYRWKLFLLILRYLDEIIISILLVGIPFIYTIPRIKCAIAAFYKERVRVHDEEMLAIQRMARKNEKVLD
ncbi:MAG: DUF975 family protein [Firmicutes bacterium]|nr:DUF975 family protein [Bacillota bacterium]